ncbi:serine/threonine-protein kinase [Streptomyces sp. NPDC001812]|uniref:non-specific serine/threonine protein kinase n=1 Tax=Streptomyces cathayae TaxID=3031124 RepID=A0ABY8KA89_9ACTN|nr:serine/threonine-protein kinase [Streptomyces sp. HUAS 5]WGD44544.1 serine/threonine-protein kinase [Streptomyces sp. HUAS 5]
MGRAHVFTHQSAAGRYRLVEVVHREPRHVRWYADDLGTGRPCLVTRIALPKGPSELAHRVSSHVLRTTEGMARRCPGRTATVVDAVDEAGFLWTVTAWIDGTPLGELLGEEGTFSHVRAARIGLELLGVLDAAHAAGVTHGELSPGQVFVRETGPVVVAGFGLAGSTPAPRLTSPSYASPEQARGEHVGPAADLWALGAILYTMVEGRPPFRDRGRPESTLKAVDRLPLRTPVRAGPLTQIVQGLLRKDARERPTGQAVREALVRVLGEDPGAALGAVPGAVPGPRPRGTRSAALGAVGRGWGRRTTVLGTALAVVVVAAVVLAAASGLPGTGSGSAADVPDTPPASASAPAPSIPSGAAGPGEPDDRGTSPPSAAPAPAPSGTAGLPAGYRLHRAPEGFSVALPEDFERLDTSRMSDLAYRVTFGVAGNTRTLAVTYSERIGPDPVAVWRDDVEPPLERTAAYERIGAIRATTYQGREAADMEWLSAAGGPRVRTFGRGFLLGGGRGFSLRWTTPAADWEEAENQEALRTFLRTFRPGSG